MIPEFPDESPVCLSCGEVLYGRTDKKFCNNICKNTYHNHEARFFRMKCRIHEEKIRRNYVILENLVQTGIVSASKEKLREAGFDPAVVTAVITKKDRHMEFMCLDIIYRISARKVLGIRRASPSESPSIHQ